MQISENGIDCLAEAVFAVDNPQVVEAYSEYDLEPISFSSSLELSSYINRKLSVPKGLAHIFVVYPDMEGNLIKRTIELNSLKVPNHKFRYTWEGWGLISIHVASPEFGLPSCVSANTEARAIKWTPTRHEIDPPSLWNWAAVKKHTSRLQRVLKKLA